MAYGCMVRARGAESGIADEVRSSLTTTTAWDCGRATSCLRVTFSHAANAAMWSGTGGPSSPRPPPRHPMLAPAPGADPFRRTGSVSWPRATLRSVRLASRTASSFCGDEYGRGTLNTSRLWTIWGHLVPAEVPVRDGPVMGSTVAGLLESDVFDAGGRTDVSRAL
jgi:hypothetical protein